MFACQIISTSLSNNPALHKYKTAPTLICCSNILTLQVHSKYGEDEESFILYSIGTPIQSLHPKIISTSLLHDPAPHSITKLHQQK
jgi:hypothetical protein